MRSRSVVLVPALFAMAAIVATAQAPSPAKWTAARTPDGHPDIQGVWSFATLTPLERPAEFAGKEFFTEQEAAAYEQRRLRENNMDRRDGPAASDVTRAYNDFWWDRGTKVVVTRRTSLVIDPPDGRIPPLTAEAQRKAAERNQARRGRPVADGPEDRPLAERCILLGNGGVPMLPTFYNNNAQIFQTRDHVAIVNEMIHDVRIIPLSTRPPLAGNVRQWLGDSHGRWEGDTLVVETTHFTDKTPLRGSSENMRSIERFTRIDEETLLYRFTVDDPATFSRPWTVEIPLWKSREMMYEYACHEGNTGMAGVLSGARAEERAAEEAAKGGR